MVDQKVCWLVATLAAWLAVTLVLPKVGLKECVKGDWKDDLKVS